MSYPVLQVPFSRVVYIEQSDFRMKDSKDYYGLAPGKSVLLRYAGVWHTVTLISPFIKLPGQILCSVCKSFSRKLPQHGSCFFVGRYAFPIKCTEVVLADDKETIVEIWAEYDHAKKTKPKVFCFIFSMLYFANSCVSK